MPPSHSRPGTGVVVLGAAIPPPASYRPLYGRPVLFEFALNQLLLMRVGLALQMDQTSLTGAAPAAAASSPSPAPSPSELLLAAWPLPPAQPEPTPPAENDNVTVAAPPPPPAAKPFVRPLMWNIHYALVTAALTKESPDYWEVEAVARSSCEWLASG